MDKETVNIKTTGIKHSELSEFISSTITNVYTFRPKTHSINFDIQTDMAKITFKVVGKVRKNE